MGARRVDVYTDDALAELHNLVNIAFESRMSILFIARSANGGQMTYRAGDGRVIKTSLIRAYKEYEQNIDKKSIGKR